MNKGVNIWAIDLLFLQVISNFYDISFENIGGRVNAEATPIISLNKSNPSDLIGNGLGCTTPNFWIYALSFMIPVLELLTKVISKFCIGIDIFAMMLLWSVKLFATYVIVQTKYIHLN